MTSSSGREIDLHLGHAFRILIYGPRPDGRLVFLESRPAPAAGGGMTRWAGLATQLTDCFALLTAGAGDNPQLILARHDIEVVIGAGRIGKALEILYNGSNKEAATNGPQETRR